MMAIDHLYCDKCGTLLNTRELADAKIVEQQKEIQRLKDEHAEEIKHLWELINRRDELIISLGAALEAAPQPETFFKQDSFQLFLTAFAADYADWHERVLKPALEQE